MEPKRASLLSSWDLLTLLGLFMLFVFYNWVLPMLPDPVPTHFNAAGVANGWMPKTHLPYLIFGLPIGIWLFLTFLLSLIALAENDPDKQRLMKAYPVRGLMGFGLCVLMGGALAIPIWGLKCLFICLAGFFACLLLGIILVSLQTKRLLMNAPDAEHYRWGVIYINAEDDRLWVPKRLGIGMTLNFAKPAAKWVMALMLLIPISIIVLVLSLGKLKA